MEFTERELDLIDGMIEVQRDHASRCDAIANRAMAEKQKGWDMERVALLEKVKASRATDPLLKDMAEALESMIDLYELTGHPFGAVNRKANSALQKYHEQVGDTDAK